jgi:[NiFe] hydrogenase assembly HybE family chaperone
VNLASRVQRLVAAYRGIAATRMAGVALCHPGLAVEAVGFLEEEGGGAALGVLVTPWFMNLVRLPAADEAPLAVGATRVRTIGGVSLPFLGAFEPAVGPLEACSLYSPMHEFAGPGQARDVAQAVLDELRRPPAPAPSPAAAFQPSRRAFLRGGARA